ncbi:SDR family oxidoreductase [Mucilaginibacter sp. FT3.2]|uniref:SDR family oxidoreductase n=1 Tax=Mucilaginibacter sp. FT3.2 TaxID=2723090 RepID=UPI001615E9F7|nr:SDR family oxidoreductase [Mucilaginibacter sp. FT3.2]MBB6230564.1 NAD(P)-dependent dehydrogenase (short-subunit alcohol dehydrogenase family) [Mucilaginibacter sp. FT3.2]
MENKKIWFVTGASKGLGLSLVKKLLSEGYKVAATSRNISDLETAVGVNSDAFLPLAVNIKSEESVQEAIEKTIGTFGKIDVVVNNAGYGMLGGLEETTDQEARDNFEVNVFGSLNVIRKALPYLREQKSGHILNISSIGGFSGGFPGFGIYCATKFAVNGFSESLAEEVKPFGIKVTIVEPGYFRTNFLSEGSLVTPKNTIAEYQSIRDSQNMHQNSLDQQQAGDPEKAAAAMIAIANHPDAPINLFLGADAYQAAHQKIASVQKDLETWKELTTSTGF